MKMQDLRYERKFIISELNYQEIEFLIKHNPAMFSEIFYERRVNNIYLDSIDLKNYKGNLSGNSNRLKIRIRWYGKLFGIIKNPVLELKLKNNELGKKLSFKLKAFVLDKKISLNSLKKIFLDSNLPKWLNEKLKLYHLALLNSYKRKYFSSADKKHRITIDKDLLFIKIKDNNNSFNSRIIDKEKYILEIKYSLKDYKTTSRITECLPFRLTACSKYVQGIDILEFW